MQLTQQSRAAHDRTKHVSLIADMPVWRVLWLLLGSYWCVYSPLMASSLRLFVTVLDAICIANMSGPMAKLQAVPNFHDMQVGWFQVRSMTSTHAQPVSLSLCLHS